MKNVVIFGFLLSALVVSCPAVASNTISVGYAQSKVADFKNMPGVNLQYRYEWDSPISVVASFTTLENCEDSSSDFGSIHSTDHVKAEYYALMAGPAYRINDVISLYALAGMSHATMDRHSNGFNDSGMPQQIDFADNTNNLAWGAGIIINSVDYLSVTLGYEGSSTLVEGQHRSINGANIGIGYRF